MTRDYNPILDAWLKRERRKALFGGSVYLAVLAVIGLLVVLFTMVQSVKVHGAEPRKPTMFVALDDSAHSQMLKNELDRNWLAANQALKLTRRQQTDLAVIGHSMRAIQTQLRDTFRIVYVDRSQVPYPVSLHLPAVKLPGSRWESIDARAFAFTTRPLLTLDWYRTRYVAVYNRDTDPGGWSFSYRDEGFSGGSDEIRAPWEPAPAPVAAVAAKPVEPPDGAQE